MREAAVPNYRLSKARKSTKILTSCGLVGIFLGLLSAVATTFLKTGVMPEQIADYYAGAKHPAAGLDAILSSSGRPLAELAEATHFHLMGGSLLLFLLCHLLALCEISESLRTKLYLTSFISFLLTFGLPWGIVFIHRSVAYLYPASVSILLISLFICVWIPMNEMWRN
jgi:hypothetical protein